MRRRKPKAERKEQTIRVRLTDEQKELFVNSAAAAGLDVSAWLRWLGMQAALKQQEGEN